jgi:hypothetical protein
MNDIDDSLQETARAITAHLPPGTAFILLACDYGEGPGRRCSYVANTDRESALGLMAEFLRKADGENWGQHVERGPAAPGEPT